jgi:hypothetical protein
MTRSALDEQSPDELYFENLPALPGAAWALTVKLPLKKWEILSNQAEPPLHSALNCFSFDSVGMKKIQSLIERIPPTLQQRFIANAVDITIRQFFPEKYMGLCHIYAIVGSNVLSVALNRHFIPVAGIAIIDAGKGGRLEMLDKAAFNRERGGSFHCWIESDDLDETVLIDFIFRHNAVYATAQGIKWHKKRKAYLWGLKKDLHLDLEQSALPRIFPDEKIWFQKCEEGEDFLKRQLTDYALDHIKVTGLALKRLCLELEIHIEKKNLK